MFVPFNLSNASVVFSVSLGNFSMTQHLASEVCGIAVIQGSNLKIMSLFISAKLTVFIFEAEA